MDTALPVRHADILAAAKRIADAIERTPARHTRTLSALAGCDIWLKFENLQFTASFKERGALNKLLTLTDAERARGVIAMSAGNHAQGVAYHAGRLNLPATIVMPEGTPFTKIKHTRDLGAEVVIHGTNLADADARARTLAEARGLTFIHPYDDPDVIAGQGTVALEFLEQMPELDALVVPVGGGGLISGIAVAAADMKPGVQVFGVQSKLYPSMYNAVKDQVIPASGLTIADGIAVKEPGALTRAIIAALVTDLLLVEEADIETAITQLLEIEKTLAEGAGAAALAAVMGHKALFRGRRVGVVVSGGNIDMRMLSTVILRDLARQGRILSLVVTIEDQPGLLGRVADLVGAAGGNIIEVSHNRLMTGVSARTADLGLVIEARDATHAADIKARLEQAGYRLRNASG